MSYAIGEFELEGPFRDLSEIMNQRGLFAVVNNVFGDRKLLDLGVGDELRSTLERHPRMQQWKNRCYSGSLEFAVSYTTSHTVDELAEIVKRLREEGKPVFEAPAN